MSFFNKELSRAHKKEHNWEIVITKKVLSKLKQLLFDKSKPIQRITLVEDNEMISEDKDKPELLNSLFSNAVKNLKIFNMWNKKQLSSPARNKPIITEFTHFCLIIQGMEQSSVYHLV